MRYRSARIRGLEGSGRFRLRAVSFRPGPRTEDNSSTGLPTAESWWAPIRSKETPSGPEPPGCGRRGQFTERGPFLNFDLHPDGKRFAVLKRAEGVKDPSITHVNLVTNWFDEVRRRRAELTP